MYSHFARHLAQSLDKLHDRVRIEKKIKIIRSFVIWPNGQTQRKINCKNNVKSEKESVRGRGRERKRKRKRKTTTLRHLHMSFAPLMPEQEIISLVRSS